MNLSRNLRSRKKNDHLHIRSLGLGAYQAEEDREVGYVEEDLVDDGQEARVNGGAVFLRPDVLDYVAEKRVDLLFLIKKRA